MPDRTSELNDADRFATRIAELVASPAGVEMLDRLYERVCALLAKHDADKFYRPQQVVSKGLASQRLRSGFDT